MNSIYSSTYVHSCIQYFYASVRERLPDCICIRAPVCGHACQDASQDYVRLHTRMHLIECGGACVHVCEYVQLTSKAAADREHYSNGAYPPLTAKKPDIYLQHEPLLEVVTHNTHWHTLTHTCSNIGSGPQCVLSFPEGLLWDLTLDLLQGVVIVPLLLIKYLTWSDARLLAETMKRDFFFFHCGASRQGVSSVLPMCTLLLLLGLRSRIFKCLLSAHTHTHTLRCFHMRSYKDKWIQNWREIEAVVHISSVGIILCAYEMPVCCRVASNFWKWAWCFIQSVWEKNTSHCRLFSYSTTYSCRALILLVWIIWVLTSASASKHEPG